MSAKPKTGDGKIPTLLEMVISRIFSRFDELKALALKSDNPQVHEELAVVRELALQLEKANEPKPAPTRYGKPSIDDFDKPGQWGNA